MTWTMTIRTIQFAICLFLFGCSNNEKTILTFKQPIENGKSLITIEVKCRQITSGTVAPYVYLDRNGLSKFSSLVNSGYDLMSDCVQSSVESVEFAENPKTLTIRMKDGSVKETNMIY